MPPPLELPTIQNWSCHSCGGCCRQHAIAISPEEQQRIAAQNWTENDGIPDGRPVFEKIGFFPWSKWYRLAHQDDGACVFLDDHGLCRIHAKFGEAAKPLACRIYPYAFHPAGKKIAVSLRFSCPSVAANRGRSVVAQANDLKALERLVVPEGADQVLPPEVSPGQRLDWPDTLKIVRQLDDIFASGQGSLTNRLLHALKVADLIGQSKFQKIRGPRLGEFLGIICDAAAEEVSADAAEIPEPSRVGRLQFRMLCAQYARRDTAGERKSQWRIRWRLLRTAMRFAGGKGLVPAVQDVFSEVAFSELDRSFGPLPADADEVLTRYLRVKLQGMHFCGAAYYNIPLVEGFQSLTLLIPAVLWMARWLAASQKRSQIKTEDVTQALSIADHHHGYSPAFGQTGFRGRVRQLAWLNEISRLVAWYGR